MESLWSLYEPQIPLVPQGKLLSVQRTSYEAFLTVTHVLLTLSRFGHVGHGYGLALSLGIFFCIAWESTGRSFNNLLTQLAHLCLQISNGGPCFIHETYSGLR